MKRLLLAAVLCVVALPAFAGGAGNVGISPCAAESLSVSGSSNNVLLSTCGPVVIVYNITSQEAFYNLGSTSSTTAATTNFSIPGNSFVTLNVNTQGWYLAAITASATTTLRIVQGYAND